jgi:hypothetical protein
MSELAERIVDRLLASTEPRAELVAAVERLIIERAALLEAELGVAVAARAEDMSGRGLFVRDDFGHPSSTAIHELVEAVCVALRNHGRR